MDMPFVDFLELGLVSLKDDAKGHFVRSQVGVPLPEGDDDDYWYD